MIRCQQPCSSFPGNPHTLVATDSDYLEHSSQLTKQTILTITQFILSAGIHEGHALTAVHCFAAAVLLMEKRNGNHL